MRCHEITVNVKLRYRYKATVLRVPTYDSQDFRDDLAREPCGVFPRVWIDF
jgi:hypothetical protein